MSTFAPAPSQSENRRLLSILTVGHGVNDFYSHVVPFLLPSIIATYEIGYGDAGLLALATTIFSSVLQPVIGRYADKKQRRKLTILSGFILYGVGMLLAGLASNYALFFAALIVFGLGQTTYHPQATHLITTAFKNTKGRAMGIHGIGGSLGNFAAPVLVTSLLTAIGLKFTLYALLIPALLITMLLARTVNEPASQYKEAGKVRISRNLLLISLSFGLLFMAYKAFLTFLPAYLVETGLTLNQAGSISSIMLLVGFLAQPLGGMLYDKVGGRAVLAISSILTGGAMWLFLQGAWPNPLLYVIIIGGAVTATFPASMAMAAVSGPADSVGVSVGVMFGTSGLLSAFTPPLVGFLADRVGLGVAFQSLLFFAAAALISAYWLPKKES